LKPEPIDKQLRLLPTRIREPNLSIYRIAHLSDPHLPPPPGAFGWRDVLSPSGLLSRIAWRRKHREHHRPEVLAALIADLKAARPDHVAITGDLTNYASPAGRSRPAKWLESLGPPTISPSAPAITTPWSRPRRREPFAPWTPWLGDPGADQLPAGAGARPRGDLQPVLGRPDRPAPGHGPPGRGAAGAPGRLLADPAYATCSGSF
jgi:hypothetical protein